VLGALNHDAEPPSMLPEAVLEETFKPPPDPPLTWQQVAGAYARRYRAARGIEWHYGAHVQALTEITAALNSQRGSPRDNGKRVFDAFFADEFAKKADFSPGLLAKQFGRYFAPPEEGSLAQQEERRRRAEDALRRHEEAKRKAEQEHARQVAERGAQVDPGALEELKQWLKRGD
jgi:hypothetical protein